MTTTYLRQRSVLAGTTAMTYLQYNNKLHLGPIAAAPVHCLQGAQVRVRVRVRR
jgi:hypothetical protein